MYSKIIKNPSVKLHRQQSAITCWFASLFMLSNWKRGTTTAYGDTFAQGHLPPGIYGLYVIQELAREGISVNSPGTNWKEQEFNTALLDIDKNSPVGTIYSTDSVQAQLQRTSSGTHYFTDFQNNEFRSEFIRNMTSTSRGVGLPMTQKTALMKYMTNNFLAIPQNRLYSPKEWLAMINHFGPLLVSVIKTDPATNTPFGHMIIVDGILATESFSDSSQIYYQDPLFGTKRGQMFPHFQDECQAVIGKINDAHTHYIWHANKNPITNISVAACVSELERHLPSLVVY